MKGSPRTWTWMWAEEAPGWEEAVEGKLRSSSWSLGGLESGEQSQDIRGKKATKERGRVNALFQNPAAPARFLSLWIVLVADFADVA